MENNTQPQPTIQDRLTSGELTFVSNMLTANEAKKLVGSPLATRASILKDMDERYGEGNVVTGNAFDAETQQASGVPGMVGVYVTTKAMESVKDVPQS